MHKLLTLTLTITAIRLFLVGGESQDVEKIYIKPHEFVVNEKGIFFTKDSLISPLRALFSDDHGLYIIPKFEASFCGNGRHGKKCYWCEGCYTWYCGNRCLCGD